MFESKKLFNLHKNTRSFTTKKIHHKNSKFTTFPNYFNRFVPRTILFINLTKNFKSHTSSRYNRSKSYINFIKPQPVESITYFPIKRFDKLRILRSHIE